MKKSKSPSQNHKARANKNAAEALAITLTTVAAIDLLEHAGIKSGMIGNVHTLHMVEGLKLAKKLKLDDEALTALFFKDG